MYYYSLLLFSHGKFVSACLILPFLACMFLEDSSVGREVWRDSHMSWLNKVSELFPVILQQESLRDGPLCYSAVKVQSRN